MVRFKNRYVLADYENMPFVEQPNERAFLKIIKEKVE